MKAKTNTQINCNDRIIKVGSIVNILSMTQDNKFLIIYRHKFSIVPSGVLTIQ